MANTVQIVAQRYSMMDNKSMAIMDRQEITGKFIGVA